MCIKKICTSINAMCQVHSSYELIRLAECFTLHKQSINSRYNEFFVHSVYNDSNNLVQLIHVYYQEL